MKKVLQQIFSFIKHDVWRIPLHELSPLRSFLIRQLRVLLIAVKGFTEDMIQLRASALTLYSMLSIVPVLAVIFGIAKGFGFEGRLNDQLTSTLSAPNQQEVLNWAMQFANNMLENTKGGIIAGIGVLVLFWSVLKVLGHIESAFNQIWQIHQGRTLLRKFSDYLSFMLIAPVFFMLSSGLNIFMQKIINNVDLLQFAGPLMIRFFPFLMIWILFTLVYMIIPNTKVSFKSALIAGIIAGTAFQLLQWGYINFQGLLSRYGTIYGSFAALPLFIMWLQVSWLIMLFGAEISFANQNIEKYEYEAQSLHISRNYKEILMLYVVHLIVKNFETGKPPYTSNGIAHELHMPIRLIREIIHELIESGVLVEITTGSEKERAYHPGIDINQLTIHYVLEKIADNGQDELDMDRSGILRKISRIKTDFSQTIADSPSNVLLKDI